MHPAEHEQNNANLAAQHLQYAAQISRFQPVLLVPLCVGMGVLAIIIFRAAPSLYSAVSYAASRTSSSSIIVLIAYFALYAVVFRVGIRQVRLQGEPLFSLLGPLRPTSSQLPLSFYSTEGDHDVPYRASVDSRRKNVILIVADSLRADHLPSFGYARNTAPRLSQRLDRQPSLTAKFLKIQHIYGMFGWAPFDDVIAYLTRSLERPYLMGERFSAADIVIGGSLPLLMSRGIVPESDVLNSYKQRILARPSYGRAQAKEGG